MLERWTELLCIKELATIPVGTRASVFRNVPKEKYIWVYLNHPDYGCIQYKIPRSVLGEHFVCTR